jgi:hypothetical protein
LRAEAANAADVGQALLKSREPAIHATVAAILRAPGIALRFGRFFNDDDNTDATASSWPFAINAYRQALFLAAPAIEQCASRC